MSQNLKFFSFSLTPPTDDELAEKLACLRSQLADLGKSQLENREEMTRLWRELCAEAISLGLVQSLTGSTLNADGVVPERAVMILHFLLPKEKREYLIGDLEEEFNCIILPKLGPRAAARWYWFQVVRESAAVCGARLRVWLGVSALTSFVGWAVHRLGL